MFFKKLDDSCNTGSRNAVVIDECMHDAKVGVMGLDDDVAPTSCMMQEIWYRACQRIKFIVCMHGPIAEIERCIAVSP